ncbi:MAG: MurR/RpiR family transcriptional regulator [Ruminococcaceae bacterium]|nr:MurR/RpiR family transcriptional regulator [Oscillospiraceae bacterium]
MSFAQSEDMLDHSFLDEIKANLTYFSHVEHLIAEAVLKDPLRFTQYSLSELSEAAGVSQGSIVNFANKYAGGGFTVLKLRVAACLSEYTKEEPFNIVDQSDSVKTVLQKNNGNLMLSLRNTEMLNEEAALSSVAEKILKAKKVEIYGVFRSALVATDLCYQLLQLGIAASFVSDVLTCAMSAAMLSSDSLVIAISSSGQTKDILDAVKLAKENGVSIVCMTGNKNSPLSKLSDDVLIAGCSGNTISGKQSEIRYSQLALADALCAYLQNILDANGKKRYFKLDTILNSHSVDD